MAKKIQKRTREAFIFSLKGKYIPGSFVDEMNIILKAPSLLLQAGWGLILSWDFALRQIPEKYL